MRLCKNVLFAALILLISSLGVKEAEAADDSLLLMLDSGFVNRPVLLEMFGGDVTISWDEGVLLKPSNLEILLQDSVTTNARKTGPAVHLVFRDAGALTPGAKISVKLKSEEAESGAFEVTVDGSSRSTYSAAYEGGFLTGSVPVAGDLVIVPVTNSAAEVIIVEETVEAATNEEAVMPAATDESIFFMLDSGFVNRPVSLEVFGGELVLAWDENALAAPTSLRLTRTEGGVGGDQTEAAKGVAIQFGDSRALSDAGAFTVTHRALRPPEMSEHPEVNVFGGESTTIQATFEGDSITYTHPTCSSVTFAPVYRDGIMRSGIASWYRYKECLCAASPDVPKGTRMKVSRQDDPSVFTVVTINDWGPDRSVHPDRVIDLDYVAFDRIGNPRGGVLAVTVDVLKEDDPLYALGDELPPPPWKW